MKFLEKDLEDIIYKNFKKCAEKGLNIGRYYHNNNPNFRRHLLRQVNLGAYGTADLILVDILYRDMKTASEEGRYHRDVTFTIIELKAESIGVKAYGQVKRYKTTVEKLIEDCDLSNSRIDIETVLIGNSIDHDSDFCYIINDEENCSFFTYEYGVDGIIFKKDNGSWHRADGISENITNTHIKNFKVCYKAPFIESREIKNKTF